MSDVIPVWLFTGPEIGERNDAVAEIRARALKKFGNLDAHSLYAADVSIPDLVSLLQNGSLFADARFVVLRDVDQLKKKEDIEALVSWIETSSSQTGSTLVLVSDEIGVDKKLEAAVPKENRRIFWELFDNRKEQWITGFFRKEGYSIDPEAVDSILELVENNTDALRTACSRFTLFFPAGYRIREEDTESLLSHNREETPFSLFDAMTGGSLETTLGIFEKIRLSRESSPVQLIAGLSWCFRKLSDWHRLARTQSLDEFSLKKAGFSGKRAIGQYRAASECWSETDTARILALLADTDREIRSTGTALHDVLMYRALYAIVVRKGIMESVPDYS